MFETSFLSFTWQSIILLNWVWRRLSLVEWSWTLLVHRMGNPATVLMLDNLSPSMAGDMQHYTSYRHFLEDLRISFFSRNFDMLGMRVYFATFVQMLAFLR